MFRSFNFERIVIDTQFPACLPCFRSRDDDDATEQMATSTTRRSHDDSSRRHQEQPSPLDHTPPSSTPPTCSPQAPSTQAPPPPAPLPSAAAQNSADQQRDMARRREQERRRREAVLVVPLRLLTWSTCSHNEPSPFFCTRTKKIANNDFSANVPYLFSCWVVRSIDR